MLLMTKFGITSIPALVLLDKWGRLICADARDKCVADSDGRAFLWQQQTRFPQAAETGTRANTVRLAEVTREGHPPPVTQARAPGGAARRGPVVNFDLPPWARLQPEPTCARPQAFARGAAVGVPIGSWARTPGGQTPTSTRGAELGFSVGFPVGKRVGLAINPGTEAPAQDTLAGAQAKKGKRKSPPSDKVRGSPPPPKPNFGVRPGPHGQMSGPTEGKPTSLMQPQPLAGVHPFTPTLKEWRHGIEVDCGPNWTWEVIEAAVARGPHPTACTHKAIALFQEDIEYQRQAGFCKVIPWEELKQLRPPNLKISPVAAVPQVGRCPCIILDLSFPVYQDIDGIITATQASVNNTTALQAPKEAVCKIGKVLPRLLTYMRDTPAGLYILMSKLDISDGFWRLIVRDADCFNFAYVLL